MFRNSALLASAAVMLMASVTWAAQETATETKAAPTAAGQPPALVKGDRIIFLGDSITAEGGSAKGFVTLIRKAVSASATNLGVEIINAGVSGNKVGNLQQRLQADVIAKKPSIVFVYIGVNDVWHFKKQANGDMVGGTPKDKYEEGLKDVLTRIKSAGARPILCTPALIGEKAAGTNEYDKMLDEYSDISRKVATELSVQLIDLHQLFRDAEKTQNPTNAARGILTNDGVHISPAGHAMVAEQMLAALGVEATGSAAAKPPALAKGDHIIFFGDSITQQATGPKGFITLVKSSVEAKNPGLGIQFTGAGVGGNKVSDLQARVQRDVIDKKPTIVIIFIGVNDVWWGNTPRDAFEANMKDVVAKIKAAGARIIICPPALIEEKTDGTNPKDAKLDEYCEIERKIAKDAGVQLCDLHSAFRAADKVKNTANAAKGILTQDGVHLNDAGNALAAEMMLGALGVTPAAPAAK